MIFRILWYAKSKQAFAYNMEDQKYMLKNINNLHSDAESS